jgi:hypothetical protein
VVLIGRNVMSLHEAPSGARWHVQCEFFQESFHYKYKGKAALFIVLVHLILSGSMSCTATFLQVR